MENNTRKSAWRNSSWWGPHISLSRSAYYFWSTCALSHWSFVKHIFKCCIPWRRFLSSFFTSYFNPPSLPPFFLLPPSFLLPPFSSLLPPSSFTPSCTLPSSPPPASWHWPRRQRGRKMPQKPGNLSTSCLTWYRTLNTWLCIARPAFLFWEDVLHWFTVV